MRAIASLLVCAHAEETDTLLQSNRIHQHQAQHHQESVFPIHNTITGAGTILPCQHHENIFKDVIQDCTNQNFYTWKKGLYSGREDPFVKPTFKQNERNVEDDNWAVSQVNHTAGWETLCVAYVRTKGTTCNEWCESQSTPDQQLICYKAKDDAHWLWDDLSKWLEEGGAPTKAHCTIGEQSSQLDKKQKTSGEDVYIDTQSDNGCNAKWNTQICGCAQLRPHPPSPAAPLCNWKVSGMNLPKWAKQDCSYGDYHIWKGAEDDFVEPSYDAGIYGSDTNWTTKFDLSASPFEGACVAYIDSDMNRKTCKEFCAKEQMECVGGVDDAHHQRKLLNDWQEQSGFARTSCTMFPFDNTQRGVSEKFVDTADNGCNQHWKTQICACKA